MTPKEKLQKRIERIERMQRLHAEGKSYKEIGEEYGISRQRVEQIIKTEERRKGWAVTEKQCVYGGLRAYLNQNNLSITGFARMIYGDSFSGSTATLTYALNGNNCTKKIIDRILKVTGLTYEEAFGRSVTE